MPMPGVPRNGAHVPWYGRSCDRYPDTVSAHASLDCACGPMMADAFHRRERFRFRVNMYTIKEEREIEPETFAHLVSSTLYERR
jgi:hypothetical protein